MAKSQGRGSGFLFQHVNNGISVTCLPLLNLTFFWSGFLLLKEFGLGPEDITESVEGLLYKQKDLSLVPSTHIKSWAWCCKCEIRGLGR